MPSVKEQQQEALQIIISVMLTMIGKAHEKGTQLTYRVFGRDDKVCNESFSFCYDITTRTLNRWRKDIRTRGSLYQDHTDSLGEMVLEKTAL